MHFVLPITRQVFMWFLLAQMDILGSFIPICAYMSQPPMQVVFLLSQHLVCFSLHVVFQCLSIRGGLWLSMSTVVPILNDDLM